MRKGHNNIRRVGDLTVDLERRILWINESPADLPTKAVELFCALVDREGEVISKDELLEHVWPGTFVEEGVLSQNVYLLRKTLKHHGLSADLIQTVARRGYRFIGTETSEVTIEREIVEQTSITEREYVQESSGTRGIALRPSRIFALTTSLMLVFGAFGLYLILRANTDSSPASLTGSNVRLSYERITASGRAFHVGLSADGEKAAYVIHTPENKYALLLHHLASKSETTIVQPQELRIFNVQFSPDGNSIYYAAQQGETKTGVYRIPIYGGSPQLITRELTHHFMLSPDGEWLSFYRRVPEERAHYLEICRSRDGSEKRTVTIRSGLDGFIIWGTAPAWSPDGGKFVAAAFSKDKPGAINRPVLAEIDVATGEQRLIAIPAWHELNQVYWQSDARGLFLLVREAIGEPMQLWNLELAQGNARNITNDDNDYREFRVSPDSSYFLAATWLKAENLFVFAADDPANVRQLTFDTNGANGATAIAWTRDGRSLVFSKGSGPAVGDLWLMDLETLATRQLTFDKASFPHYADTTPDGRSVVFGSNRTGKWHIWRVDLNGENLTQITNGDYEAAPEVSPDGKWLYFIGDGLNKKPIDGGEPVKIMSSRPGNVRVSPANTDVFASYIHDNRETVKNPWKYVLFAESDTTKFTDLNIPANVYFEWNPDGSGIYYADNGESFNNLWLVNTKSLARSQITQFSDQRIGNFSLSPDGRTFAISRGSAIGNIIKIGMK